MNAPATLDCCPYHAAGGAVGQDCSDIPDVSDLFTSLDNYTPVKPAVHVDNWPGKHETDALTLQAERDNRAAPYRGYYIECRTCGATRSRGPMRNGVKQNPLRCPVCEPKAYAREHGTDKPTPARFITLRRERRVVSDGPTLAELEILCALEVRGASEPDDFPNSKRQIGNLMARRWVGRRKRDSLLVLTGLGRSAMQAALKLVSEIPTSLSR